MFWQVSRSELQLFISYVLYVPYTKNIGFYMLQVLIFYVSHKNIGFGNLQKTYILGGLEIGSYKSPKPMFAVRLNCELQLSPEKYHETQQNLQHRN